MTLLTKDPFVSAFDAIEFQIGDCAERTPQADWAEPTAVVRSQSDS